MTLLLSDHAKKRVFERGITLDEVKEIVRQGRKWKEDSVIHASMRGIEVVYRNIGSDTFIITVHYK
jgi:hypothetical protein